MAKNYGLHWFRRDLRIIGNPALSLARERFEGRVLGIFFFDAKFLSRSDFSHRRFGFFLQTLRELKKEMVALGGDLLVLDLAPETGFPSVLKELAGSTSGQPSLVTFNRDYEPYARTRDQRLTEILTEELGIPIHSERDHLLIEPHEIAKPDGGFYQVFTPFSRRWAQYFSSTAVQERLAQQGKEAKKSAQLPFRLRWKDIIKTGFNDQLEKFIESNRQRLDIDLPIAGTAVAKKKLDRFRQRLEAYDTDRDFPDLDGTSQLSIYLKNGSLTTSEIISQLKLSTDNSAKGPATYLRELIWREFYYHILFHRPDAEVQSFNPKYRGIRWKNSLSLFEAWKNGTTGYAIVDAGMRQLKQTGWMHNRVRMIAASFLSKDLLIDWRWGERHFMQYLLDGDLAPNNGGWQWAASTGCDPQPYFRIFNPILQGLKFDPDALYIKRFVPERAHLEGKAAHAPIAPVVEHSAQIEKALNLYRQATSK